MRASEPTRAHVSSGRSAAAGIAEDSGDATVADGRIAGTVAEIAAATGDADDLSAAADTDIATGMGRIAGITAATRNSGGHN